MLIPVDFAGAWTPPEYWDAADIALEMTEHPDIWTDGSREDFSSIGGFEVAGAGVYLLASELAFDGLSWEQQRSMVMLAWSVVVLFCLFPVSCRPFSVPSSGVPLLLYRLIGPVIEVLTTLMLFVALVVCLIFDCLTKPLPLVKDGDLIALVQYMIRTRGRETVRVTKVKGYAEDVDVQQGHVRLVDQHGNVEADTAADLGRRHQTEVLINARRRLLQARSCWYPIMTDLHRFMIAIGRVSFNHDGRGGTAPDPLVWDQGSRPKVRKLHIRVNVDLASLLGPPEFLDSGGCWSHYWC